MSTPLRPWHAHYASGVRPALEYPDVPLPRLLDERAAAHPHLTALIFYKERQTYGELQAETLRVANLLTGLGVQPGDRVALFMPNCPQYVAAYYGIMRTGAIVTQVNPIYVEREIEHILTDSGADVVLTVDLLYPRVKNVARQHPLRHIVVAGLHGEIPLGPEVIRWEPAVAAAPATAPGIDLDPGAAACLQYTGGTTGVSKGAVLTHRNLVANCHQVWEWFGRPEPGTERILTILPLFHSYGMTGCMNYGLMSGAALILLPRWDVDEALEAIREHRPTSFPGVPTMYIGINSHPRARQYGIDSIRVCNSGAAPLPAEVIEQFERKTGAEICEGYGLSEASPVTHVNPFGGRRKVGSIGLPVPDTDCRVVDPDTLEDVAVGDVGELWVRGPQVMACYWNRPDETAHALVDGWLRTGDMVRMDDDGYFYVVDRQKDMIIAGGYNIYPREIEEVLYEHPAVEECCVAGVPDEYRGETVKAYVVLKPRATATADELIAHCRERLAAFKVPRLVELRKSLPTNNVGKILRRSLVEQEQRRLGAKGPPLLVVEEICVDYGPVRVLSAVSLEVLPGELVSIIGANGAGKTTLLKAIAGTLEPEEGRIVFGGVEVQGFDAHRIARHGLALVPEGRQIFSNLTVWDNLLLGAWPRLRRQRAQVEALAEAVTERFPVIRMRKNQAAGTLSGGEQQMLAIARALMAEPRLLVLDEPSLGLAPAIVDELFEIVASLRDQGTTVLLVEQKAYRALQISDWAYVLETGRIASSGPARQVMESPAVARAYLGGARQELAM